MSAAAIADRVKQARASRTPLRIVGRGSWMNAGAPVPVGERLELSALHGIVEYEPGDLTLTARAATTLSELAQVTAAENQWIPLDPFGSPDGSIGATVATGAAGPLASAFGTPRDQVLGVEIVTGLGEVVRAGGRVVKNVAGFDITRLMIGAWGTLGALTEVTVRLRARPEADVTVAVQLDAREGAERARRWLRATPFTPYAAELASPSLAARAGLARDTQLLLRFGGNEPLVRAAIAAAASLGNPVSAGAGAWSAIAAAEPANAAVIRVSAAPSVLATVWKTIADLAEGAGGFAHATVARGVARMVIPLPIGDEPELEALRRLVHALPRMTRVCERLPASCWSSLAPSAVNDSLSRAVRRAFDPDRVLNPGILGDTP